MASSARFSTAAVNERFTRTAEVNPLERLGAAVGADRAVSFPELGVKRAADGAEREGERIAGHGFDVGADDPAESSGNGARQRDRLDLQVKAAISLFGGPPGVESPEEAVVLGWSEGMLPGRTG